jgi:raffinose/stachyose/melibiose transport system substrate-binding protein
MPLQFSVSSMVFYNSDMWKSIGFDKFPDNWEDILSAPEKFKAKGIQTTIALGNKDKWPYESTILSCLGDRFTGTEWTENIIACNGKSKFTDSSFVKALEFSQKLAQSNLFNPDYNSITDEQATMYYCQGKAAAIIDGMWDVSYINLNATDEVKEATKIALLPPVEGGKGEANATSGGAGWFIAANSNLTGEKLEAAKKFIYVCYGRRIL